MARIGGVNIPNHQHTEIALTAIYGVGRSRARLICVAAGINTITKIKDLSDSEMEKLREQARSDADTLAKLFDEDAEEQAKVKSPKA